MFSGGFKEAHQKEVILEEVDPDGFNTLLKFLYTGILIYSLPLYVPCSYISFKGEIIMTTGNMFDVISLADIFLVTGLSTPCFLKVTLFTPSSALLLSYLVHSSYLNFWLCNN